MQNPSESSAADSNRVVVSCCRKYENEDVQLTEKTQKTGTFANNEDPDKMLQNAAFYQGLHYLLRQNHQSSEKEIHYFFWKLNL